MSNPEGFYMIAHPAGTYNVTASATGFKSQTIENVTVIDGYSPMLIFPWHLSIWC